MRVKKKEYSFFIKKKKVDYFFSQIQKTMAKKSSGGGLKKKLSKIKGAISKKAKKGEGKVKRYVKKHQIGKKILDYGPGVAKALLSAGGVGATIATGNPMPMAVAGAASAGVDEAANALKSHYSARNISKKGATPTGARTNIRVKRGK